MALANLIFPKENKLATVELDIVISESVNTSSTITENPVEQGADVTDHIITNAMTFSMTGVVSDTPVKFLGGLLAGQSLLSGEKPSIKAWDELLKLQATKEPFTLVQNLKSYPNVFIESLSTTQDKDTSQMLRFTANMKEIIMVGTQEISEVQFDEQDTSDGMVKTKDEGLKQ
ncbi:MAG: hypothetical protein U9Q29_02785 [Campylobacterota bacterium]|nr:hypothetical protein [Campylobacterota bacterium]